MLCSFCTIFCTICECSGVKEKLELQDEFISAILIFTFTYSWLLYSQTTFIPFSRKPIFHTCVKLYCQRLAPEDNPLPKGPLDFKFASISCQMRRNMRPVSIIQISFDLVLFCCSLHMKSNDIKKKKKNYTAEVNANARVLLRWRRSCWCEARWERNASENDTDTRCDGSVRIWGRVHQNACSATWPTQTKGSLRCQSKTW